MGRVTGNNKNLSYIEAYVRARIMRSKGTLRLGSDPYLILLAIQERMQQVRTRFSFSRESTNFLLNGNINSASVVLVHKNNNVLGVGSSLSVPPEGSSGVPTSRNAYHSERQALIAAMNNAGIRGDLTVQSPPDKIKQALSESGVRIVRVFTERPPCYTGDRYPDGCQEFFKDIKPEDAKIDFMWILDQKRSAETIPELADQLCKINRVIQQPRRITLIALILERLSMLNKDKANDKQEITELNKLIKLAIEDDSFNFEEAITNLSKRVESLSTSDSQPPHRVNQDDSQLSMQLMPQQNLFLQTVVDRYLQEMDSHGTEGTGAWGGDVELEAIAEEYEATITVQNSGGASRTFGSGGSEITLEHDGTHYNAIISGGTAEVSADGDCMFRACLACLNGVDPSDITLKQINTLRNNVVGRLSTKWAALDLDQKPPYIQYHALFQSEDKQQLLENARVLPAGELLFEAICLYYFNKISLSANEADKNVLFAELCSIGTEEDETFLTGLNHYLRKRMRIKAEDLISEVATADTLIQIYSEEPSQSASKPEPTASSLGEHFAKVTGEFETQASTPSATLPPLVISNPLPPSEPKNPDDDIKDPEKPGKKPKRNNKKSLS